jgi:hypothetical protein
LNLEEHFIILAEPQKLSDFISFWKLKADPQYQQLAQEITKWKLRCKEVWQDLQVTHKSLSKLQEIKCEVSTVGTFSDPFNPMKVLGSISWTSPKGKVGFKGFEIGGSGGGFGTSWNNEDSSSKEVKKATKKKKKESEQEKVAKNNQKMFDKFKNDLDKSVDPSLFNSGTINFNYSLGEFFNRLTSPIFFYRTYISELLYNNLEWNNNKQSILNLDLRWNDLVSWTQGNKNDNEDNRNLGKWKWQNVCLEQDYGEDFFTRIMEEGYSLDGGEKIENPKLVRDIGVDYSKIGGNAWDIYSISGEVKETKEERNEKVAGGDISKAEVSHVTFFYADNPATMSDLKAIEGTGTLRTGHGPFHWDSSKGWCWGCMAPDASQTASVGIFTPSQNCRIKFILHNDEPSFGQETDCEAKVSYKIIVKKEGNKYNIYFESTKIKQTFAFNKNEKTVSQELNEKDLENNWEGNVENIELDNLNLEDIQKEEGEKGIGNNKGERENVNEWEDERFDEKEKEDEDEKINELENQQERERLEKERLERERLEAERREQTRQEDEQNNQERNKNENESENN